MGYTRYSNNKAQSLLDQRLARMATCWKIERLDSQNFYLTDHDQNIILGGNTYTPAGGANPSDLSSESGMKEDNLDIIGVVDDDAITVNDLMTGAFQGASVTQYTVDWMYPWTGYFEEVAFFIGDITWTGEVYKCQLVGITQQLDKTLGRTAHENCPYVFGKHPCLRTDLVPAEGPTTVNWNVTVLTLSPAGLDPLIYFTASAVLPIETDGYYDGSRVEFITGTLAGEVGFIKRYSAGVGPRLCELILPMKDTIDPGDTVYIYNRCDRTLGSCQDHGNNKNFGGNHNMPGMDRVYRSVDSIL